MSETFSFEELLTDNDFTDFKVDTNLEMFGTALENLDTLLKLQNHINMSSDISQESTLLLVNSVYTSLGISKDKIDVSLEAFRSNNKELASEGISDVVGKMTMKIQNVVNGAFGFLENTWNKNIRGFRSAKNNILDLENIVKNMGSGHKNAPVSSAIRKSFRTSYNSNILKPDDVYKILNNHNKVADAIFSSQDSLRKVAESDIKSMGYLISKAKAKNEKKDLTPEMNKAVSDLIKLFDIARKDTSFSLAEGKTVELNVNEEGLKGRTFHQSSIYMTLEDGSNNREIDQMLTASKSEATKILKELKDLIVNMENKTDTLLHISAYITESVRGVLIMLGALAASIAAGALLGIGLLFFVGQIVALYGYYYFLICAVITFIKLFSTKFTNLTYRAMDSAIEYIEKSASYA